MYTNNAEAAYCKGRIERSTALAIASVESCARLSHEGMAALYQRKLTGLMKSNSTGPSNLITPACPLPEARS